MKIIDLTEQQSGCLCNLCGESGEHKAAQLLDEHLGPLCHECFAEALNITGLLRWSTLISAPAEK